MLSFFGILPPQTMKKLFVTFLTAFVMTVGYLSSQNPITALSDANPSLQNSSEEKLNQRYSDVEADAWFAPYIEEISEIGLVEGYPDGRFGAWDPVNRAELAKIIVLLRAELRSHWLKDNVTEIALVLATLMGWIYILIAFRKSSEQLTRQILQAQSREREIPLQKKSDPKAEQKIEKNLKSNWWV